MTEMEITALTSKHFKIKNKSAALSLGDKLAITRTDGSVFEISGHGEYEVGGISVVSWPYIILVEADGARVALLKNDTSKLSQEKLDDIGPVDVVLVPTDGADIKVLVDVAKQLDPWIIVPSSFNPTAALKELGVAELNPVNKLVVSADKLPSELQIVVLKD